MVHSSWFKVHGSRFMVQGSWFKVHGSRFMVQGSWFIGSWFIGPAPISRELSSIGAGSALRSEILDACKWFIVHGSFP
ncbi:MAG: hypothetical protein ACUZ77_07785 [Candidatus Brocadiales bacterium]